MRGSPGKLVLGLLGLASCGLTTWDERVNMLRPRMTTEAEAVALIGQPISIVYMPGSGRTEIFVDRGVPEGVGILFGPDGRMVRVLSRTEMR